MKKSDLRNGSVVETRNGLRFLVVDDFMLLIGALWEFMTLHAYNNDLILKDGDGDDEFDIVRVNNYHQEGFINQALYQVLKEGKWTWERVEVK